MPNHFTQIFFCCERRNLLCSRSNGDLFTGEIGSISAVSRVRSLILPEEGDECGLIFPNSGW